MSDDARTRRFHRAEVARLAEVDDVVMGRAVPAEALSDDPEVDRLVHRAEHGDDLFDLDGATDEEYEVDRLAALGNRQAGAG